MVKLSVHATLTEKEELDYYIILLYYYNYYRKLCIDFFILSRCVVIIVFTVLYSSSHIHGLYSIKCPCDTKACWPNEISQKT